MEIGEKKIHFGYKCALNYEKTAGKPVDKDIPKMNMDMNSDDFKKVVTNDKTLYDVAILIFFSTLPQSAFAAISVPPNSTDSSTPLTVTPNSDGSLTWYFDGNTEIVNSTTNATIGNTYRYKSSSGATVTMINPGSIGDWVDAFGENTIK